MHRRRLMLGRSPVGVGRLRRRNHEHMTKSSRVDLFCLLALTLGALGVRLVGIDFCLPQRLENDAYLVHQAEVLRRGVEGPGDEIVLRKYPHLLARLLALGPPVAAVGDDVPALLRDAAAPTVRARILVAILSALLVPATWLLVRMLFGRGAAYLAAIFVATSLLHFTFSQQARPHGAHATFATLSVVASIGYRRYGGLLRALLAGIAAATAISCLQFGLFVLPALFAAIALRAPRRWRRAAVDGVVASAPLVLALVVFYPWAFAGGGALDDPRTTTSLLGSHGSWNTNWTLAGFGRLLAIELEYDPVLLGLGLAGLLGLLVVGARSWSGRRRWWPGLDIAGSFVVPYVLVVGGMLKYQERFLLPALPYVGAVAALAVRHVLSMMTRRVSAPARISTVVGSLVIVFAFPFGVVTKAAWLRSRPDTLTRAARWLEANVDRTEDVILAEPSLSLPLLSLRSRQSGRHVPFEFWEKYELGVDPTMRRALGYRLRSLYPSGWSPTKRWTSKELLSITRGSSARFVAVWADTRSLGLTAALEASFGAPVASFLAVESGRLPLVGYGYQGRGMRHRVAAGVAWGRPVKIYSVTD